MFAGRLAFQMALYSRQASRDRGAAGGYSRCRSGRSLQMRTAWHSYQAVRRGVSCTPEAPLRSRAWAASARRVRIRVWGSCVGRRGWRPVR